MFKTPKTLADLFFRTFFVRIRTFISGKNPDKKSPDSEQKKSGHFFYRINLFRKNQYFSENIGRFQSILKVKNNGNKETSTFWAQFFSQPPSAAINNIISSKTVSNHGILSTPTILSFFFGTFFVRKKSPELKTNPDKKMSGSESP